MSASRLPPEPPSPVRGDAFTIVWWPDTQFYGISAQNALARWCIANKATLNIQFVGGLGDLVDDASDSDEWDSIDDAVAMLDADGSIPYMMAIGNHDYDTVGTRDASTFNTYFPQSRYTGQSWWNGGFYEAGTSINSYLLLAIGGIDWIFINLEFGPRQAALTWAGGLLSTYSTRRAMLFTHSYMYRDDTRCGSGDSYNPHSYIGSDVHDGDEMWDELVKLYENVWFVQSGHDLSDGLGYREDSGDNGNTVRQCLANYQVLTTLGWLRYYVISPANDSVQAVTYSPLRGGFLTDADNVISTDYTS